MGLKKVLVERTRNKNLYRPGEQVEGFWTLEVDGAMSVRKIRSFMTGAALVLWKNTKTDSEVGVGPHGLHLSSKTKTVEMKSHKQYFRRYIDHYGEFQYNFLCYKCLGFSYLHYLIADRGFVA